MRKEIFAAILVIVSILMFAGTSLAIEFSSDIVMTAEGKKMTGKMYAKGELSRMEMTAEGKQIITITRVDKKVSWTLMPEQKMYMEMPLNPKDTPKTEIKGEIDRKLEGSETIDGHPTNKYLITYKEGKTTEKVHQWVATDINFPLKTADVNNKWVHEFKNVKVGSQPDSLFEVPDGYNKMKMPGMLFNMMRQGK